MQAYTIGGKTIGRLCPEGADGKAVTLDDGSTPGLSLFFQFADGLFAKFWKRYDEILRHGDRALDVDVMASPIDLRGLKALEPVTCRGIKCLIDTAEYSLPSGRLTPVALSLRSISTQGDYDIDEEQGIPAFSTTRRLAWFFLSDDLDAVLASTESREAALAEFKASSGYEPHGTDGDYWYVDLPGVLGVSIAPAGATWDTDDGLQKPVEAGRQATKTYQAAAVYDIYEIHDLTTDRESPGPFYLSDRPIGSVTITVDYHVVIVTRWVAS
jgi:hypothetical protein